MTASDEIGGMLVPPGVVDKLIREIDRQEAGGSPLGLRIRLYLPMIEGAANPAHEIYNSGTRTWEPYEAASDHERSSGGRDEA